MSAAANLHALRNEIAEAEPGFDRLQEQGLTDLSELLGLGSVGLRVTGARLIGEGPEAAVYLELSNGREMGFKPARDMAQPNKLLATLALETGARPRLNQASALDAVALVHRVAKHVRTMGEADQAIEWGVGFLQAAEVIDVDLYDQGERWAAFSRLASVDPRARHRESNVSIAAASVVLRHVDGSRLVRAEWLTAHVRVVEPRVTPAQVAVQMQRVGWLRRGREGRWKATRPGVPGQLNWAFWFVPAGWEDLGEAVAVTAGTEGPPAHVRARVEAVTDRNPAPGESA